MSGAGGGQGDDKNSMALLWIVGFIFAIGLIIWFLFAEQLKFVYLKVRFIELILVGFFIDFLPNSVAMFHDMQADIDSALLACKALTPEQLTPDIAGRLSAVVGDYLRVPATFALAMFCYLMYGRNVKMRYRKHYSMESLAQQESAVWPQINPVLGAKIEDSDVDNGPWAMAMPPLNFCKHYNLITIRAEMPTNVLSKGPEFKMVLDKQRAQRVFAAQLGKLWQGAAALPIHRQAIFATFIARGCRDTKTAQQLLLQISRSCEGGRLDKLDFTGTEKLWKKHIDTRGIADIIKMHAYEATVFTALYLYAREDGVFSTVDFLWLKPFDRKFWYFLNNVGRQTAFCEAAGVHAHFLAEKALRRPLGVPMVNEATKALEIALQDIIYVPTPEEKDELLKQLDPA